MDLIDLTNRSTHKFGAYEILFIIFCEEKYALSAYSLSFSLAGILFLLSSHHKETEFLGVFFNCC